MCRAGVAGRGVVGWIAYCLVGGFVGTLVASWRMFGWLVGWLVGRSVGWQADWLAWLVGFQVG